MNKLLIGVALLAMTTQAFSQSSQPSSDGWKSVPQRDEIAPKFSREGSGAGLVLTIAGQGSDAVNGSWQKEFPVAAGKHVAFGGEYLCTNIRQPLRCVLVRLIWLDKDGQALNRGEFPITAGKPGKDGWTRLAGIYLVPEKAATVRAELCLRWAADGQVSWRNIAVALSQPPPPRKVRLGTVSRRPSNTGSPQKNLELFAADIAELAGKKADLICLPEGITVVGTGKTYADVAEAVPGPTTKFLGELAARHKVYIAAGIYERDGKVLYNTCVLVGRDGKLVGKYRKTCLPDEEIVGGLCAGKDFPVFDTDFGRVGMMICWDLSYPEVARNLAAKGAEVLLMPIWGGDETLARARAIENQVFLVASGYDFRSAIYAPTGKPLAVAAKDPKEAAENLLVEVDLNSTTDWPWIGNWKARVFREEPVKTEQP